tara:strand:- start:1953 stop:2915 length:963 start_codon:yes stop_codon:yes gene_type:complete
MNTKKICVVGVGEWGKNHVATLSDLGALAGIVESDTEILNRYLKIYPDIKYFSDIRDAIAINTFDGFTVATPAETHFDIAKCIIEAGKPVLVEKPLTLSIQEAEKLVALSKANEVALLVGHVLLFHPAIRKIKEIISGDRIGKIQYVYSNRLNLGQVRTEENVFWSLAPHDIAIFQYLIEEYPKKISSTGSSFLQAGIQDLTMTHLKYGNGVEGHIFVSWLHPFKEHRLVVVGSEGMITFEDTVKGRPLKIYSKKFDFKNGIPKKVDGPVELVHFENKMPLTAEMEYFIDNLNNKNLKTANVHQALDVIKILVEASGQIN